MHYTPQRVAPLPLKVGDRVRFEEEPRRPYAVRAVTRNFAVVTRQVDFRPQGELQYSVIDWRNGVRGPVNIVGQGWDCKTDDACDELCRWVEAGRWEVSHRNWVRIRITQHMQSRLV